MRRCGARRRLIELVISLGLPLLAPAARADAVPPPPPSCPRGYTPATGHDGPYCRPPAPSKCPPGHLPRVSGKQAYCEPPPKEPCPPGSDWTSMSADDTFCHTQGSCESTPCGPDATCVPASYCLSWTCFRCSMSRIVGVCSSDADCPEVHGYGGPKSQKCYHQYLCDPKSKRVAADYKAPAPQKPPAPIDLAVLPKHELAGCGYESCPRGQLCLPLSLCVGELGKGAPVVGSCEHGATCPEKSTCIRRFRCVDPKVHKPTREGKPVTAAPSQPGQLPEPVRSRPR